MRMIKASKMSEMAAKIAEAKRELAQYDEEKVAYVRECQDEIMQAISDSYREDESGDLYQEPVGPKLSEIKRDYLVGAIEDDLMTEEEFEDIFDAIDILDMELAHTNASTNTRRKSNMRRSSMQRRIYSSRFSETESDRRREERIVDYLIDEAGCDPYDILIELIAYMPAVKGLDALYKYADDNGISLYNV